jgi:hypothetical protein
VPGKAELGDDVIASIGRVLEEMMRQTRGWTLNSERLASSTYYHWFGSRIFMGCHRMPFPEISYEALTLRDTSEGSVCPTPLCCCSRGSFSLLRIKPRILYYLYLPNATPDILGGSIENTARNLTFICMPSALNSQAD